MQRELTQEQTAALQEWIAAAQPTMRLSHWCIEADAAPPGPAGVDDDAYAGSFIFDASDRSKVHIGDAFWTESPDEQRHTLVHELLHCHLYRGREFARVRLKKRDQLTFTQAEDIAIEQLARIIAPLLPLPAIPPFP